MDSAHVAATAMELMAECQHLRDEIGRLRQVLIDNDIDPDPIVPKREAPAPSNPPSVNLLTTPQKIELFRSLFRGRDDVYAARWESPDGRHGYSPAAQRDWKAYHAASIENRKRVDKETRKCVPLTDQAIHDHLSGKQTLGVYPLLRDETCAASLGYRCGAILHHRSHKLCAVGHRLVGIAHVDCMANSSLPAY